jgi:hypothetical protein
MGAISNRDLLSISAIVPPLAVLFSSSLGLYMGWSIMSVQAQFLWIACVVIIALLVWFNAAAAKRGARETKEQLDKIEKAISSPGATLADVAKIIHHKAVNVDISPAVSIDTKVKRANDTKK